MTEEHNLYEQLSERIGLKGSERIPKLFRMIADEEEARLLLAMPGTIQELADRTGKTQQELDPMLDLLFRKGLVFHSKKPQGTVYRMCRNLIQFHDATILWKEAPQEFLDLWQEYMETEWPKLADAIDKSGMRPFFRVIPVDQAIQGGTQVLPYETARKFIENARSLAVTNCTCRLTARKCDQPLEICIQLDKAADYAVTRGTGRSLTKEEALHLLEEAQEKGLVHCSENKAGIGHVICNCCPCCCQVMPLVIQHGKRLLDPSRFRARVDPDRCVACETCVERCIFQAMEMEDDHARVVDEKCMGCGVCATGCPSEAIELEEVRPQDFIPKEMRV